MATTTPHGPPRTHEYAGHRVGEPGKDKAGGRVVNYFGLADELRQAMPAYIASGGPRKTALDQSEVVAPMVQKYVICSGVLHGLDWPRGITGSPQDTLPLLAAAQKLILTLEDG